MRLVHLLPTSTRAGRESPSTAGQRPRGSPALSQLPIHCESCACSFRWLGYAGRGVGGARSASAAIRAREGGSSLQTFHVIIERDPDTGVLVGYVPGWPGAHTQGADTQELLCNLREVIEMLLEDGEPQLESEFVDVQTILVA